AASSLAPRSSPCPPCFCFPDPAPPDTYTLSLHDALPISLRRLPAPDPHRRRGLGLRPDRVLRHEGAAPARPLHPVLPRRRAGGSLPGGARSEERRVGKECGARWAG